MEQDFYKVLGTTPKECTTSKVLKKAFRNRMKEVHPDKGGTTEQFQEVNRAYEALKQVIENRETTETLINIEI